MVVVQRNEITRNRFLNFVTIILSIVVIARIVMSWPGRSESIQLLLVSLGILSVIAMILSIVQIYAHPKRSQILLIHRDDDMVIATNALHEGFKLRFLRDILSEHVFSFSDEDRERWKTLEADGFYATLYIQNVRKVMMVRLCTMIFDDVFTVDRSDRWEHHDSSSTSEPPFSKREMPRLKSWGTKTNAG